MELFKPQEIYQYITNILERTSSLSPDAYPILLIVVLLCGIIYGFFGYRIYKWVLACFGACVGGIIAIQLLDFLTLKGVNLPYVRISFAAILALVGGIVAPKLFRLLTFMIGGSAFGLALHPLVPVIPEPYGWLVLVIGFAAGGFLAFILTRPTLITATALAGSYLSAIALFTAAIHFELLPKTFNFALFEIVWAALTLGGIIAQFQQKTPSSIETMK